MVVKELSKILWGYIFGGTHYNIAECRLFSR